jgi:hypothetical protein
MDSVRFNYLYRDGANFKNWGKVIFANPEVLPLKPIESKLLNAFLPDKHFIASQIQIPDIFLFLTDKPTAYDHCFHEFDSVEICDENPTDIFSRSISEFLSEVENEAGQGWRAFNILDCL